MSYSSPKKLQRNRRRYGAALIEFGLVALALLTLMVGILQFGIVYFAVGAVNNGAREGTRYGSVHPDKTDATQPDSIQSIVKTRTNGIYPERLAVAVNFPDGTALPNDRIKVTASYQLPSFLPFLKPFAISKSSVMRIESKLTPKPTPTP